MNLNLTLQSAFSCLRGFPDPRRKIRHRALKIVEVKCFLLTDSPLFYINIIDIIENAYKVKDYSLLFNQLMKPITVEIQTCRFRSSVIRDICIFFRPIVAAILEGVKGAGARTKVAYGLATADVNSCYLEPKENTL